MRGCLGGGRGPVLFFVPFTSSSRSVEETRRAHARFEGPLLCSAAFHLKKVHRHAPPPPGERHPCAVPVRCAHVGMCDRMWQ